MKEKLISLGIAAGWISLYFYLFGDNSKIISTDAWLSEHITTIGFRSSTSNDITGGFLTTVLLPLFYIMIANIIPFEDSIGIRVVAWGILIFVPPVVLILIYSLV